MALSSANSTAPFLETGNFSFLILRYFIIKCLQKFKQCHLHTKVSISLGKGFNFRIFQNVKKIITQQNSNYIFLNAFALKQPYYPLKLYACSIKSVFHFEGLAEFQKEFFW
jgi:hypothetical protein